MQWEVCLLWFTKRSYCKDAMYWMLVFLSLLPHLRNNTLVIKPLVIYERLILVKFWNFHLTCPLTLTDGTMANVQCGIGMGEAVKMPQPMRDYNNGLWNAPIEGSVFWKCGLQVDILHHHPFVCFLIVVKSPHNFQFPLKISKSKHFIGWYNDVPTPIEVEDETPIYYCTSGWLLSIPI